MIERISGKLITKSPTFLVVDCHGLGFGISVSVNTSQALEQCRPGNDLHLHTYLHVREDTLQLFGFAEPAEKEVFQELISISGVGPKLAIAILSGITVDELKAAIVHGDVPMLTKIPGVGKKTAQRLILELKEKIQKHEEIEQTVALSYGSEQHRIKLNEAVAALISLGYKQRDARTAVNKIVQRSGDDLPIEEIVKLALKEM